MQKIDPFQIFDIIPSYMIDKPQLKRKYQQYQQKYHTDRCPTGDCNKIQKINCAYTILQDDVQRATYLLKDIKYKKDSMEELMEQLEFGEKKDNYISTKDVSALQKMQETIVNKLTRLGQDFQIAFEQRKLNEAQGLLGKMHFYDQQKQQIKEAIIQVQDLK
ncbi:Co-chaperone_HscB [Hexamita inflata]|uniref:Co-chaperone HscB n=1 Tax=Hexamita inflata TaxID=28002 RepID=A0AA86RNJ9_9EUKA|nr:Co-chaperone HscB [Hexamita inflata]